MAADARLVHDPRTPVSGVRTFVTIRDRDPYLEPAFAQMANVDRQRLCHLHAVIAMRLDLHR